MDRGGDGRRGRPAAGLVMLAALGLGAVTGAAHAQDSTEDRLRTQLRETVLQLRQLQDNQAQMQAQLAQAQQQRDQAQTELKAAQAQVAAAKGRSGAQVAAERELAAQRAARAQDERQLAQQKSSYQDLLAVSRSNEAKGTQMAASLKAQQGELQSCEAKNAQLYAVGHEILQAYEHVGLGTVLKTREPFAQGERVKYDMIAQGEGDRLYGGQYVPGAQPASAATK